MGRLGARRIGRRSHRRLVHVRSRARGHSPVEESCRAPLDTAGGANRAHPCSAHPSAPALNRSIQPGPGIADHVWTFEEVIGLLSPERLGAAAGNWTTT